ncbi:MAG: MBL fold metallo-hydrolase [Planctomycetes bacterium]|nr:MBL fold metallo-hydrolase [Planctomycetota bacterium]
MIVRKSLDPTWLSNTYLVADRPGGHAVLIDTGAPPEPILAWIEELGVTVTHALCTHHHLDHLIHRDVYQAKFGCPICGHASERELFGSLDQTLSDGEEIKSGGLTIRALHIPGHTLGQLAFLVNEAEVFTGDTLFRGSVGGTLGPGHTTCADIKHSILDVLLALPEETVVRPGHMEPTTVRAEREENLFVRAWRGLDPIREQPCTVAGQEATLLLRAPDYDGGTKCWVRLADGQEALVGGSRVSVR